ncbi:MAG TPA: long-chain fatty acid--CoA ligase [Terriglobales bacterium]|nr:long-chain fatty acid--CoA ligase [Terriglobales bacterium]
MNTQTINEVFYEVVERNLPRATVFKRTVTWTAASSRELYRNVVGVAKSLRSWGIGPGDRVAILSENRPEWAVADFATMLLGAASVPIYPTLTLEHTAYMLADSGARVLFVSTPGHLRKVLAIKDQTRIEKIVLMQGEGPDAIPMAQLMNQGPMERDRQFDERALSVGPDEIATLIYTSGTTGTPKGAMLTQHNLASNLVHSLNFYGLGPGYVSISFLPLSHITARHLDYAMYWHGATVAYCPYIDELMQALLEVRPTVFVAVPRVYEKIYNQVQGKVGFGLKRKLYNWAMGVGRRNRDQVFAGKRPQDPLWNLADMVLFSNIRKALGGKVEIYISGGAPLSPDLINWYASIGVRIFEGYGLTETSPVIALNNPIAYRPGSVGKPLSNLQVKIAEDGEILVKGPSVFKGYWNKPEETAAAFEDGWFHTGDVGRVDDDGFLYVTDRKKDLIKTSGGKFIAPQPIEIALKLNPLVAEAAVIGDRRKFPLVVIAPQFPALETWARHNGVKFTSWEELSASPRVTELYKSVVAEVNANLAQFEKIKKVLIVPDEFTVANGALTPTLKLKRRVVEERYRERIEQAFATSGDSMTVV